MQKVNHNTSDLIQESNIESELRLCILPNEILREIFSYLDPETLLTMKNLGIQRFTDLSQYVKCANFSSCCAISEEDVSSFFTKDRTRRIVHINLDYVFRVKDLTLEKCISKCKNLTTLSIMECGLSYQNIFCIFENCPQLKELYWTLSATERRRRKISPNLKIFQNIKKLYIHVTEFRYSDLEILGIVMRHCLCAEDVCINCTPYFSKTVLNCASKQIYTAKVLLKDREQPINIVMKTLFTDHIKIERSLEQRLSDLYSLHSFRHPLEGQDLTLFIKSDSYLQFVTQEEDFAKLPSLPNNSIESLIVILTSSKELFYSHMER
ncbi:uncharacterized protein CEXT_511121 [Caerostris extrusa]|uniref:F-box domain-containing protein n=1 Tax=Caerostris extrusa TaxID=172846 RepID=A0AAV4Y9V5_CAEEX|nr:uncharacterized protein CEXT_511121 [Caerostris extrusa]